MIRPRWLCISSAALCLAFSMFSGPVFAAPSTFVARLSPSIRLPQTEIDVAVREMRLRLVSLGILDATVAALSDAVKVSMPESSTDKQTLGVLTAKGQLLIRPVWCGANRYSGRASTTTLQDSTRSVPTCAAPYRFNFTDYRPSSALFNYPPADPLYDSIPTTAATAEVESHVVIMNVGQVGSTYPRLVLGPAAATGAIFRESKAEEEFETKSWVVVGEFTSAGSKIFKKLASTYFGQPVANVVDGILEATPVIASQTFAGSLDIAGNYTAASAQALAAELNSGPLPAKFELATR